MTARDASLMPHPTSGPTPLSDASTPLSDASAPPSDRDASATSPDAGKACAFGHASQCMTRAMLEDQAKWGVSMVQRSMPIRSDAEAAALFLANGCLPAKHVFDSCCNPASSEATIGDGGLCCYDFCSGSCCGRPFLVQGKLRMARAMRRGDWLSGLPELADKSLPMALRERAATEWLEDARMEHASIAAFARFTLELLAFGAPAELVTEAQLAGIDEIDHARLCFALASRYAGVELGPTALSMAEVTPATTLRESVLSAVIEGCIGETLAAARANAALEGARDQATRTVLGKIAEDETRHAELAYRYVAWALTREPALAHDIEALIARESDFSATGPESKSPQLDMLEPALSLLGRLSNARGRATHRTTFAQVILPCIRSLLDSHAKAPAERATRGQLTSSLS